MKRILTLLLAAFLAFPGCNRCDVLAEYDGGKITASDFNEWIELMDDSPSFPEASFSAEDIKIASPEVKRNLLEVYFFNKVISHEVRKRSLDKTSDYQFAVCQATADLLKKELYKKIILADLKFSEPAIRISQIFLPPGAAAHGNGTDETGAYLRTEPDWTKPEAAAKEIIFRLGQGEKFEELAGEYAQSVQSRWGDIGYQTASMMPADYAKVAFSLKEGEFCRRPLRIFPQTQRNYPAGVYVIKVTEIKELNEKNMDMLIPDEGYRRMIRETHAATAGHAFLRALQQEGDVELHPERINSKDKNEILFKVGDVRFSGFDLDRLTDLVADRMKDDPVLAKMPVMSFEWKEALLKDEYFRQLLKRSAERRGMTKDPVFLKRMEAEEENAVKMEYVRQYLRDVSVTGDEIRLERNVDGKNQEDNPPAGADEEMKRVIMFRKQADKAEELRADLRKDYNFKVYEKRLK